LRRRSFFVEYMFFKGGCFYEHNEKREKI